MDDRYYTDPLLRAEALVRGWALILALAASAALPVLWVRGTDDEDHYETALGAVPYLLGTGTGDLGSGQPAGEGIVVVMRVTAILLVAAVGLALATALGWSDSATLAGSGPWLRVTAGWAVVATVVALALVALLLGDPDEASPERYEGVDVGPGMLLLLVAAALLLASPTTAAWPRTRGR